MAVDWRETWKKKLVSPHVAIKHIKPGNRVFIGSACGEPQELVRALVETGDEAEDTELMNVLTMGVAPYTDPKYSSRFRANAFLQQGNKFLIGHFQYFPTDIFGMLPETGSRGADIDRGIRKLKRRIAEGDRTDFRVIQHFIVTSGC